MLTAYSMISPWLLVRPVTAFGNDLRFCSGCPVGVKIYGR